MAKFNIILKASRYYFQFMANNGNEIFTSNGYTTKEGCMVGSTDIKSRTSFESTYHRSDILHDHRFNLLSASGQIVAHSEGYITGTGRENAIIAVKTYAAGALVFDMT
ncbi:YegP family protein [Spirosoma flavum]|uniref:YegP family protein n=1 Tax=Spirosoma flavum TaxID=2048557 RepID=A0ABW6APF8_9BACT